MELAEQAGLSGLLTEHVRFTSERVKSGAANPTPKLTSVIAGMAAGADSIEDLDVIRSGGMKKLFGGVYACAVVAQVIPQALAQVIPQGVVLMSLVDSSRSWWLASSLGSCGAGS
jgi:hypothetical protein